MKANQPAQPVDEDDDSLGNDYAQEEDLGLPSSIIAVPRQAAEMVQKSAELADA